MGGCRFCTKDTCNDISRGCPERLKKITILGAKGSKATQPEIWKRLREYLREYSAYSLGITSNPKSLIEKDGIKTEYRTMYVLWTGTDPAGIASLWGDFVKQIRSSKGWGKRLEATGPTDLDIQSNEKFTLYLLVR